MSLAPIIHNPMDYVKDEIPRWWNPVTKREEPINQGGFIDEIPRTMEWDYERDGSNPLEDFGPIGTYKGGATIEELPFLENFMEENQLADLSDYRRRWINHTSGKDVITDPIYRKNLQDLILYPDRFGFNVRV